MGLFSRWSRSRPAAAPGPAQIHGELERFARDALAHADRVQLDREVHRQKLVIAFLFGAIDELAHAENLDETRVLAASVMFLNHHFPVSAAELGSVTELRQEFTGARAARHDSRDGGGRAKQDAGADGWRDCGLDES